MNNRTRCLLILGLGGLLSAFGWASRSGTAVSAKAIQERAVELQLADLSQLLSKGSGIEQHFDYKVSQRDGFITIANQRSDHYIHIFGLNKWRQLVYEIRELQNVKYLIDYYPSSAKATVIPNPITDPTRYALVALRRASLFSLDDNVHDLTYLAGVAQQALTPKGHRNRDEYGIPLARSPDTRDELAYVGLRYAILDRESINRLRTDRPLEMMAMACLYVVEEPGLVNIFYYDGTSSPEPVRSSVLRPYLTATVSHRDLARRVYQGRLVRHDWTSTQSSRLHGLNRLFGPKTRIELLLYSQSIFLENGRYRPMGQGWCAFTSAGYTLVDFENFGAVASVLRDNLLVTEVIGPVPD